MELSAGTATQLPPSILILSWAKNGTVQQSVSLARPWLFVTVKAGEHPLYGFIIIVVIIIIRAENARLKNVWTKFDGRNIQDRKIGTKSRDQKMKDMQNNETFL